MLNFFKRQVVKAKLAIHDASAPEDEKMQLMLPACEKKREEVNELRQAVKTLMHQHALLSKTSAQLTGVVDVFYNATPNKQTDSLLQTFIESSRLLHTTSPLLLKIKNQVLLPMQRWEEHVQQLERKIDLYEQANVLLHGVKYECKELDGNAQEVRRKGQQVPLELQKNLHSALRQKQLYGAALQWMHEDIFALARATVDPEGFYTTFDAILTAFVVLQQEWFSEGAAISSRVRVPVRKNSQEAKEQRSSWLSSSSSSSSSSAHAERSSVARSSSSLSSSGLVIPWNTFETGEEALERIGRRLENPRMQQPPSQHAPRAAASSPQSLPAREPVKGLLDMGVDVVATDRTTTTSTLKASAADIAFEPVAPAQAPAQVPSATSPAPAAQSTAPLRSWVDSVLSEGKLVIQEGQFLADDDVSWRERVDLWAKAARDRKTGPQGEKLPKAWVLLVLLPTLTCVVMERGEREGWFSYWLDTLEANKDQPDRGVMKAYRRALKLFSSFAARPDAMLEPDFSFVSSKVVDTLKRAFLAYQQQVKKA